MDGDVTVRVCTAADLDLVLGAATNDVTRRHHRERWDMQTAGQAIYLVAWRGDEPVGRGTVLRTSKYDSVVEAFGPVWEINALEAFNQGQGIGTRLIAGAEAVARGVGSETIGIAVGVDNDGARRLYERLGYEDWGGGHVMDEWSERDEHGTPTTTHRDLCRYLMKNLTGRPLTSGSRVP